MPRFRKKPILIEAEQYRPEHPRVRGVCDRVEHDTWPDHVHTIHQDQAVALAFYDWVLPEPDGEHY